MVHVQDKAQTFGEAAKTPGTRLYAAIQEQHRQNRIRDKITPAEREALYRAACREGGRR